MGLRDLDRFAVLAARLERPRARGHEVLLVDGVDRRELGAELVGLRQPLLGLRRAIRDGERPRAVLGELVAEHRLLEIAEDGERLVDRGQAPASGGRRRSPRWRGRRTRRRGASPPRSRRRSPIALCALARASSKRPIDPSAMARLPCAFIAGTPRAGERARAACVVLGGGSRVGQAHREVPERHRDGDLPGAVLEPLGDVLREAQRPGGLLRAVHPQLELRLREVHVELLAQPRAARRSLERAGRLAELGVGVVGAPVDGREDGALDGEARRVERVPRGWGARERRGELRARGRSRPASRYARRRRTASAGSTRVRAAHHGLDPRDDERPFVRGGERSRSCAAAAMETPSSAEAGDERRSPPPSPTEGGDGARRARRPAHASAPAPVRGRGSRGGRRSWGQRRASPSQGHCSAGARVRLLRISGRRTTHCAQRGNVPQRRRIRGVTGLSHGATQVASRPTASRAASATWCSTPGDASRVSDVWFRRAALRACGLRPLG